MQKVLGELEQQRDNLYAYSKAELNSEPPAILESLREQNNASKARVAELEKKLASASVASAGPSVDQQQTKMLQSKVDAAAIEITTLKSRLAAAGGGAAASGQFAEVEAQQRELLQRVQQAEAQRDAAYARAQQAGAAGAGAAGGQSELLAERERQLEAERKERARVEAENKALQKKVSEAPKSSACAVM